MRRVRGQATVELALGSLVMITIIMFGIHFAEVGMLSLKVQEAAAWATWEASGRRVLDLEANNTAPFDRIVAGAAAVDTQAELAYRDFNGLTSVDSSDVVIRALTRGERLDVQCRENRALRWLASPAAAATYHDRGGFECTASAQLAAVNMPFDFLNGADGFFNARQYDARGAAAGGVMRVCALGRATGSSCDGQLAVLLGDWGLAGDREKGECKLAVGSPGRCVSTTAGAPPAPPNDVYRAATERLWVPAFYKTRAFANTFAGGAPADPNEFWFSYSGVESNYDTTVGGEGIGTAKTGGAGIGLIPPLTVGNDCFLGKPGC